VLAAQPAGSEETYYFNGHYYSFAQAEKDFLAIYPALENDVQAAGYPTLYNSYSQPGFQLDHFSIYDWIEQRVPGGHKSKMGQLLDVAFNIEYGADTRVQSSLNLLYLLGFQNDPNNFALFGQSDEHYRLKGGNESLPRAIAGTLPVGALRLNRWLRSIAKLSSGGYLLTFTGDQCTERVVADHVILSIPFSVLHEIDYSQAGFNEVKRRAIATLRENIAPPTFRGSWKAEWRKAFARRTKLSRAEEGFEPSFPAHSGRFRACTSEITVSDQAIVLAFLYSMVKRFVPLRSTIIKK